jgi:FkbM family methyltransferase
MRNIIVEPNSFWRIFIPLFGRIRQWCWKGYDRIAQRFILSGGEIPFLDATLNFPLGVAMTYSTPLFWNGPEAYEGPTSRTLATLISRSRVFLDVGSNVGIYAVYAGVKHPAVVTYAFEPVPAIWEKNRAFHRANRLPEDRALHMAVGDRVGPQQLILPIYTTGVEEEQTGTLQADSWQTNEARVEKIEVPCITLDEFAATHALPEGRCCLKIDVENHEAAVLRGGTQFIAARRPWIVCEILPDQGIDPMSGRRINNNSDVMALVEKLAYTALAITSEGLFRMTTSDFERPRTLKDFVLIPTEVLPSGVSYLPSSSLVDFLPLN